MHGAEHTKLSDSLFITILSLDALHSELLIAMLDKP
jgi:hypothetical protein